MSDEPIPENERDDENSEEAPEDESPFDDPDVLARRLPKGAPTEPGLPPPRD